MIAIFQKQFLWKTLFSKEISVSKFFLQDSCKCQTKHLWGFFKITPLQSFDENHWKMSVKVNHFMKRDIIFHVISMDFEVWLLTYSMTYLEGYLSLSPSITSNVKNSKSLKIQNISGKQKYIQYNNTLILKSRIF